jgi:hypothetical protein
MTGGSIPPSSDKLLLMTIEFINFEAAGFCFAGTEGSCSSNWCPARVVDAWGGKVLTDWGTCSCTVDNPPDDCGVCGGEGLDQGCGCGLEYNCELQPGACDCAGNVADMCGVCGGGNADQDCAGECFGTAEIDCWGICGGNNVVDECGVCDGDGSSCRDCDEITDEQQYWDSDGNGAWDGLNDYQNNGSVAVALFDNH